MSDLEEAMAMQELGPGEWRANADARYEAGTGMFGGWTAAMLLKSVINDARAQGTPSTLTVHYLKQIQPGSEIALRARPIGGSRSLTFWSAEIAPVGQAEHAAIATVLTTLRRPSDSFAEWSMPNMPEPNTLPEVHPPGTFGERTLVRGQLAFDQPNTKSNTWVRETSGRVIDHVQLAYLADAYAPRIFFRSKGPRRSSTITMSIYFHATAGELAVIGDDYILTEATGTRAEQSTVGSQARLWSRQGSLLATTEQLCWFR